VCAHVCLIALVEAHREPLAKLFADNNIPRVTQFFDPFPLDDAEAHRLTHERTADLYWGVWKADVLVGLTMVRGWENQHQHRAIGVLIDRNHHGRGIGRIATGMTLDHLRERRESLVRARVHESNDSSVRMLTANGFLVIGRGEGRLLLECDLDGAGPNQ
jgi:RimJ/RimL family protein N-acetyltransferase